MLENIIFNIWFWVFCFVLGTITQGIGKAKGRDNCFWWGFAFGIIGLVIVICMKSNDLYSKLEKLQSLKDAGTIDEVEFEVYKSDILKENNYNRRYGNNNEGTGILAVIIIIVAIILCVIIFPNVFGTKNKIEFLQEEVQELIEENWKENGVYGYTIEKDLVVTHKDGNTYSGIIQIKYLGKSIQITGEIIYDGKYVQWIPDRTNIMYQLLY